MRFQDMYDELLQVTQRLDQPTQITRSLRRAITQAHSMALFKRDIVEDIIDLPNPANRMKIPLPPNFKKFKAVAPRGINGKPTQISTDNNQYKLVEDDEILDQLYNPLIDVCYVAGDVFVINSSIKPAKLYLRWYANPDIADLDLETWIMQVQEDLILDLALVHFYKKVGREDLARSINSDLIQITIPNFIANYASAEGL